MLKPSYSELMQILNNNPDLDSKITSRYAVVIAASKRARQLIDGAEPQAVAETNKAVSVAVMEMNDGLITIFPEEKAAEEAMDMAEPDDATADFDPDRAYSPYDWADDNDQAVDAEQPPDTPVVAIAAVREADEADEEDLFASDVFDDDAFEDDVF